MKIVCAALSAFVLLCPIMSLAAPITYEGVLLSASTVYGDVSSAGEVDSPSSSLSDYWLFEAQVGRAYKITGTRLEPDYDMAMFLFDGTFTDDDVFAGALSNAKELAFADDEINRDGPYDDPQITFAPEKTGRYTLVVTNFLSGPDDGGDGMFRYSLTAVRCDCGAVDPKSEPVPAPVPLPSGLPLLLSASGLITLIRVTKGS